ncbi:RNA polymerase factor sigma-54 [soil metagenome]
MSSIAIRVEHRQHQTLTPQLQQAVRLLQLSSLDFAQEVQQAMGRNPFLEGDDIESEPTTDEYGDEVNSDDRAEAADASDMEAGENAPGEVAADMPEDYAGERDSWQNVGTGSNQNFSGDSDTSMMEMVAADVSLQNQLHGQLNVMPLSPRDKVLVHAIVESLDDDGYLRIDLKELVAVAGLVPVADVDELQFALRLVQSLEPAGVAARTVSECLQLQLASIACDDDREMARIIVTEHMDRLAQRDIPGLARLLNRKAAEVEVVCDRIRHLDPRPGWRFGSANVHFVTPDVIVKKVRGSWTATLNPAIVPKVRLNHVYADLFQRHRDGKHAELAAHLQEARWTVRNVEQRFSTILSVAQAILKRQRHFLEYGALAMKPLGLREIAQEVGLHESTVSRVTNNKYMATPVGVFELKYFFSRAMPTASGGASSATAIRGVIKEMIEAEQGATPLSDAEIARLLARQGLTVARRTVTKYRQMLRIPAVERRRRHA